MAGWRGTIRRLRKTGLAACGRTNDQIRDLDGCGHSGFTCSVKSRVSAGLVMFRRRNGRLEFFLAHPGGPFARLKDEGSWTIPKGEPGLGEPLLDVAKREFEEETGIEPHGPYIELGSIQQKGGKWVFAWAFEGDCDGPICSNTFQMEWPPKSGKLCEFPEIDRAEFHSLDEARRKIKETQFPLLERLVQTLGDG